MEKRFSTTIILSALIGSLLLFSPGCSKKNVIPPDTAAESPTGGRDINYPLAEGEYSEDNLPRSGTLDDNIPGVGSEFAADQQSDEYKRLHGRCSANLSPIYFDFDQAGIRPDMIQTMAENAEYLQSIPESMVIIEGNSDERGTNEYNLALGERRAINVQQYLANIGVDSRRMRTLSYGEEKPLFMGQDEESYGLNRRVDFIVK